MSGTYEDYESIFENQTFDMELIEDDEDYDFVYDEEGNEVPCDLCDGRIAFENGKYVCPYCEQIFTRAEFFNYIGANPPGDKCLTCTELYPGCTYCPNGYPVKED